MTVTEQANTRNLLIPTGQPPSGRAGWRFTYCAPACS